MSDTVIKVNDQIVELPQVEVIQGTFESLGAETLSLKLSKDSSVV